MATNLTAEAVWNLIKDLYTKDTLHDATLLFPIVGDDSGHCYHFSHNGRSCPAHVALALIVDAMKREMGSNYIGCNLFMPEHNGIEGWVAYYTKNGENWSKEGDTEAEAVIAAYRAWKEAK